MAQIRHLLLVGNPNVGKSVIFGLLTGRYAVVSNYPGTTVELARGNANVAGSDYVVVDTPGTNSLLFPTSDDEVVTRDIVLSNLPALVVQIADAKNLARALMLTLELAALGCPTVLCLNMSDESAMWGLRLDHRKLAAILGIPVVPTIATERVGIGALRDALARASVPAVRVEYAAEVAAALQKTADEHGVATGVVAAALSRPDVPPALPAFRAVLGAAVAAVPEEKRRNCGYELLIQRMRTAHEVADEVMARVPAAASGRDIRGLLTLASVLLVAAAGGYAAGGMLSFAARAAAGLACGWLKWLAAGCLTAAFADAFWRRRAHGAGRLEAVGDLAMSPAWGLALLVGVLYSAYVLVGVLVAGNVVDFLTSRVFGEFEAGGWGGYINGPLSRLTGRLFGGSLVYRCLFDEDGGVISKGVTYSFGIVGPIVAAFFLLFGLLEDSGYLPRLSVISDRFFKRMGLSGRAALPMVLGLGCDTMAALATRILPTRRERLLAILLLALAIPCSAQLGIIVAVLSRLTPVAVLAFAGVILLVLVVVGMLGARVLGGAAAGFILEIPPFRPPLLSNVMLKTWHRSQWFLREAVPVFLLGSLVLWVLKETALLGVLEAAFSPLVRGVLGLPESAARGFLLGFLRRDYAAVEIFSQFERGLVDANQTFVALVTITLFVPCVANFFVIIKEAGMQVALKMIAFIVPFAFVTGGLVRLALALAGIHLGGH